jgi:tetratricopeptide (TPR) repeat protein
MKTKVRTIKFLKETRNIITDAHAVYVVIFVLFVFSGAAFGQEKYNAGQPATIAGKTLMPVDSPMVNQLFFSALREKTIENLTKAADLFERVIQLDPANDASLYELANLKKLQNDYPTAQTLLEKAVSINKDNEWYWIALANCYEKNNDFARLLNVFDELIRIAPDNQDYYFDKANAYFFLAKYDAALKVYDQIEQMTGPSDDLLANRQKIYLKQGKVELAAKQLEQTIAANPSEMRYYLLLAEIYNSNNLTDKALKVLQTAEKVDAGNGPVHLELAEIYRNKKNEEASYNELLLGFAVPELDIDQKIRILMGYVPRFPDPNAKASALELSKVLTEAHPGDARAYAIYGDMLAQNNRMKEAKGMYKKSFSLNNQVYEVQEQLVRVELGANETDEAIADGENSLSLFPNQAWMNYLVGIAWYQKKDFKKAAGYLKNAASLGTDDKELLSQSFSALGDCYHTLKDYPNSDSAYEKAITFNPDNVYTLNNYAYYLSLRGEQLEKAAGMAKHANELQANNASFEDTYAWILFKQKDYAGAKLWIEKALADDKDNSAVKMEHYGDIMFYIGNIDVAVENWKKAKANGDQSPVLERKINERKYIE